MLRLNAQIINGFNLLCKRYPIFIVYIIAIALLFIFNFSVQIGESIGAMIYNSKILN